MVVDRQGLNVFQALVQVQLADLLKPWEDRRQLFRALNIDLRVAPHRLRLAPFSVFSARPTQAIPEHAPLAIVEIVSPDDRHEELMDKLDDYERAGAEFIFIADPRTGKLRRYRHGDLQSVTALELPEHGISIPLAAIFG